MSLTRGLSYYLIVELFNQQFYCHAKSEPKGGPKRGGSHQPLSSLVQSGHALRAVMDLVIGNVAGVDNRVIMQRRVVHSSSDFYIPECIL